MQISKAISEIALKHFLLCEIKIEGSQPAIPLTLQPPPYHHRHESLFTLSSFCREIRGERGT